MHPDKQHTRPVAVITGMGLATSLGRDVDSTWAGIRSGRIGLGRMDAMESALPESAVGGQAAPLPADYSTDLPREARYLRWVIEQAIRESHADREVYEPGRCATILGTTLHGLRAGGRFLRHDDPGELRHFLASAVMRSAIEGLGLGGLSTTTCSACSSSLGAIALGITMLEAGEADLVVAGGYDAVSEYAWAGFNALRLVAPAAVMPFSKQRRGMMLGEGYGVVVLERAEDAKKRRAHALAALEGWGESADAHHLTQPDPSGAGAARAMREAMKRAGVTPGDVSMITAHATATPDNDAAEYAGYRAIFGDALPNTPVVGFKSYLGHTLGGAGAVELVLSVCALRAGWVPPCANVQQANVEFPGLTVAPPAGLEKQVMRTLNMSLGFGGANTCAILGRAEEAAAPDRAEVRVPARQDVEVWLTGHGVVLPGITGIEALLGSLTRFDGLTVHPGAIVSDEQLAHILNARRVRRLSTCVKLMLASVSLAIKHSGLDGDIERLAAASAILASTHGSSGFCSEYYTQIVREGVLAANPALFAEGVPNAAAAHVSANFGIRGACQTIIGSRTAGLDALSLAAMRIRSGACETVIVGAAEETHANVDRAYARAHVCHECDGDPGLSITAGAVAFVLESSISASARGARPLARIARCANASALRAAADSETRSAELDAPTRVLQQVRARGVVLGSGNHTRIDRAEAAAVHLTPGTVLVESLYNRVGDLFAAGPLLGLVRAIAERKLSGFTSLCTDFTGTAAAVTVESVASVGS